MSQVIQTEGHREPMIDTPPTEETDQSENHHEQNSTASDSGANQFSSLPVQLRFEIGEIKLPFSQLQSISSGVVFALDKPLDQNLITIYANEVPVAIGELVCIDELVGVQVQRLLPTMESADVSSRIGTP